MLGPWNKNYDKHRQHFIKQRHYFANKGPSGQSYGFSSSHVRVGLQRKLSTEELMVLNCSVIVDSWESLGLQGDQTSQSSRKSVLNIHWKDWYFGHLMWRTNSLEKTLMLGKIEGGKRRGRQRMRWMVSSTQAPGVGDGQWGLVCCSPWGHKELDATEQLNWTDLISYQCPLSYVI